MVQPLINAINVFLAIFNALPVAILQFIYLSLFLFVVYIVLRVVFKIGG